MELLITHLPICSICTKHLFQPATTPHQLACKHLFCKDCILDLRVGVAFKCPFDSVESVEVENAELHRVVLEAQAALPHVSDPRCIPYLQECYAYILRVTNTEKVPCRSFYKEKVCPNQWVCPYDHMPGLGTRGPCPRSMNCPRGGRCVFDHQPAYIPRQLITTYHEVYPWYSTQSWRHQIMELPTTDKEHMAACSFFSSTMKLYHIVKIERVQNANLYLKFASKHEALSLIAGKRLETMLLFHGTSKTDPYQVCADESGVDNRLSKMAMWGNGSYFAKDASYSKTYSYKLPEDMESMLLCEVIVGDYIELPPDVNLARPPQKEGLHEEYHSVKGTTARTDIWITYEPCMSYPRYIITYQKYNSS